MEKFKTPTFKLILSPIILMLTHKLFAPYWETCKTPEVAQNHSCNLCLIPGDTNISKGIALLRGQGFQEIGQGGFGIVMINPGKPNCAIKFIKDKARCKELNKEFELSDKLKEGYSLDYGIAKSILYKKTQVQISSTESLKYCQYNQDLIMSEVTDLGRLALVEKTGASSNYQIKSILEPEEISESLTKILKVEELPASISITANEDREESLLKLPKNSSSWGLIKKFSKGITPLTHMYLNEFSRKDYMKGRGFIWGTKKILGLYDKETLNQLSHSLGQIMSQIIIKAEIMPTDVEVVIGRHEKYGIVPNVIDFNEAIHITDLPEGLSAKAKIESMVRSIVAKNGKQIFPNIKYHDTKKPNPFYQPFKKGFLLGLAGAQKTMAEEILALYEQLAQ